eukprot:3798559-Prymnesium_polylepis.1
MPLASYHLPLLRSMSNVWSVQRATKASAMSRPCFSDIVRTTCTLCMRRHPASKYLTSPVAH